jgi:hypothetical protein
MLQRLIFYVVNIFLDVKMDQCSVRWEHPSTSTSDFLIHFYEIKLYIINFARSIDSKEKSQQLFGLINVFRAFRTVYVKILAK